MQNYLIRKSLPLVFVVSYSGSVVKTKIQAFYNEPISVAELGRAEEWIPIYTAGDLQNIQNDLAGNYKLMNDIDMSDFSWKPIGEDTKQKLRGFTGTLDGQNFSISNLSLKAGKSYRDSNLTCCAR